MPVSKEPKVRFDHRWVLIFLHTSFRTVDCNSAYVHAYTQSTTIAHIFSLNYLRLCRLNLHTNHSSSLLCLFLCCLSKVGKNDKDHRPTPSSPLCSSSLHLNTHEKTGPSMPPLMAGTLFISPANLSSFSFRTRGMRGWEESAKSIKYVKEDGQRNGGIKRGSRGGNYHVWLPLFSPLQHWTEIQYRSNVNGSKLESHVNTHAL